MFFLLYFSLTFGLSDRSWLDGFNGENDHGDFPNIGDMPEDDETDTIFTKFTWKSLLQRVCDQTPSGRSARLTDYGTTRFQIAKKRVRRGFIHVYRGVEVVVKKKRGYFQLLCQLNPIISMIGEELLFECDNYIGLLLITLFWTVKYGFTKGNHLWFKYLEWFTKQCVRWTIAAQKTRLRWSTH